MFNCIAAPFCKDLHVDQYSNLLAGANTLMHFVPVKTKKEVSEPIRVLCTLFH